MFSHRPLARTRSAPRIPIWDDVAKRGLQITESNSYSNCSCAKDTFLFPRVYLQGYFHCMFSLSLLLPCDQIKNLAQECLSTLRARLSSFEESFSTVSEKIADILQVSSFLWYPFRPWNRLEEKMLDQSTFHKSAARMARRAAPLPANTKICQRRLCTLRQRCVHACHRHATAADEAGAQRRPWPSFSFACTLTHWRDLRSAACDARPVTRFSCVASQEEEDWAGAAGILAQIPLTSSQRNISDEYKAKMYVRIAML